MNKNDLENRSKKTGVVLLKGDHWYSASVAWLGFAWIVLTSSWHCQGDSFIFSTQQKKTIFYQGDRGAKKHSCHVLVGSRRKGWRSESFTWLFSSSGMLLPPLVLYKVCWHWLCWCQGLLSSLKLTLYFGRAEKLVECWIPKRRILHFSLGNLSKTF